MPDMTSIDRAIAERIIQARIAAGLSKVDFAEKLGLTKQGYNPYEKFVSPYTIAQIFKAARVLGVSVGWLLGLPSELTLEEQHLLELYRESDRGIQRLVTTMLEAHLRELENNHA